MNRDLTAAITSESDAAEIRLAYLFYADFPSGEIRLWSGVGELSAMGETWTGAGSLISVGTVTEAMDSGARGLTIDLSGLSPEVLAPVLNDDYQGRIGTMWLAMLDDSGAVIPDPVEMFTGRLDSDDMSDDGHSATLTMNIEHRLADLLRRRERRYTLEDQQLEYPDDMGLQFVSTLKNAEIKWGAA